MFAVTGWVGDSVARSNNDTTQRARHVIVIGVDGLSPDGIRNAETPNIDELMAKGAWSMNARGVLPTSSSANWASMLAGAGPEQHGVTSNDWRVGEFNFPTSVTGSGNFFPSIFQVLADQFPDLETGSVYNWDGFANLYDRRFVKYDVHGKTEEETATLAASYIKAKRPAFLFVHLDNVDHVGHAHGHGTAHYYAAVAKADASIGTIRRAVVDAGIAGETVIIVTSDHGGVGKGHGGATLAELEIPWVASGKGVKPGYRLDLPINTFDTPATALWLLGAEIPYAWLGRPVRPILTGEPVPAQAYRTSSFYASPVIEPEGDGNAPSGGLFLKQPVQMTIRNPDATGEIRYTLDSTIPTNESPLYEGPVQITRSTIVRATLFVDGQPVSIPATGYFRILDQDPDARGLRYSAYLLPEGPVRLPDFSRLKPAASGRAYEVSIDDLKLPREHAIGVVFEGWLEVATGGNYEFSLASDDGSKLYIGGKTVVDNDGDHGVITASGSIDLKPGRHPIRVEYFNGGGGSWLGAWFKGPGIPRQFIDPNMLSPQ
ncbi:MAG: alkaline phosphatase family protein [Sphingomonadaceae bacterium]